MEKQTPEHKGIHLTWLDAILLSFSLMKQESVDGEWEPGAGDHCISLTNMLEAHLWPVTNGTTTTGRSGVCLHGSFFPPGPAQATHLALGFKWYHPNEVPLS